MCQFGGSGGVCRPLRTHCGRGNRLKIGYTPKWGVYFLGGSVVVVRGWGESKNVGVCGGKWGNGGVWGEGLVYRVTVAKVQGSFQKMWP